MCFEKIQLVPKDDLKITIKPFGLSPNANAVTKLKNQITGNITTFSIKYYDFYFRNTMTLILK